MIGEYERLVQLCLAVEPLGNRSMQRRYIEALVSLCVRADATCALDIGTCSGTSCLSSASALKLLGRDLSRLTTIDIHHGRWKRTWNRLRPRLDEYFGPGWSEEIRSVEKNFKTLRPQDFISADARMFVFYDIHDLDDGSETPCSPVFINEWIPLIARGIVAVHDINACDKDWKRPRHWSTVPSAAIVEHWTGQWYRGFGEVAHFINWSNKHKAQINSMPKTSIVWFKIKDGKPVK